MKPEEVLAWGSLYSADFSERTLEFRIEGDMPPIACGRYAIVPAEKFRTVIMQAHLWQEQQKGKAA